MRHGHIDLNLPRVALRHMTGSDHTPAHHMVAGGGIMVIGVLIAKSAYLLPDLLVIHVGVDLVGYLIHGIGAVPFIEHLIANKTE